VDRGECLAIVQRAAVADFVLNNYKLGVTYADQLVPPSGRTYRKVLIADPQNLWKNAGKTNEVCYLLQSEQPHWPHYCRGLVSGPGLGNIVESGSDRKEIFCRHKDLKTNNVTESRCIRFSGAFSRCMESETGSVGGSELGAAMDWLPCKRGDPARVRLRRGFRLAFEDVETHCVSCSHEKSLLVPIFAHCWCVNPFSCLRCDTLRVAG
jgi:hypothetical protein